MATTQYGMLTYQRCVEIISQARNRRCKLLAGNTILYAQEDGSYTLEFHGTTILTYTPDGVIHLTTNYHRTVTTKKRLCQFGPVYVNQSKHDWYVGSEPFFEGYKVYPPNDPRNHGRLLACQGDKLAQALHRAATEAPTSTERQAAEAALADYATEQYEQSGR